jgi:hypothetical protein
VGGVWVAGPQTPNPKSPIPRVVKLNIITNIFYFVI